MEIPKTRYARSADGAFIAYQVLGGGEELDLLWISPWLGARGHVGVPAGRPLLSRDGIVRTLDHARSTRHRAFIT
jgi:hypothetical protein